MTPEMPTPPAGDRGRRDVQGIDNVAQVGSVVEPVTLESLLGWSEEPDTEAELCRMVEEVWF